MADFLVIGLNALGRNLAHELVRLGARVTVADIDKKRVAQIKDHVDAAVTVDTTDRRALEELEPRRFDHVVVCMARQFEEAERTTLALHDFGARHVTNVATTKRRRDILELIGARHVVTPGLLQARNLAVELVEPAIHSFWFAGRDQGLAEVVLSDDFELGEDDQARALERGVRLVAGRRRSEEGGEEPYRVDLDAGSSWRKGDSLLFFGRPADIRAFVQKTLP